MTRNEREELNQLSKEVFGSATRWQKLMEKGYLELVTEDKEEEVPGEEGAPATKQTVKVPILENGMQKKVVKYHTVESITELMRTFKKQREEMQETFRKMREQQEAMKKAQEDAGGSAL